MANKLIVFKVQAIPSGKGLRIVLPSEACKDMVQGVQPSTMYGVVMNGQLHLSAKKPDVFIPALSIDPLSFEPQVQNAQS